MQLPLRAAGRHSCERKLPPRGFCAFAFGLSSFLRRFLSANAWPTKPPSPTLTKIAAISFAATATARAEPSGDGNFVYGTTKKKEREEEKPGQILSRGSAVRWKEKKKKKRLDRCPKRQRWRRNTRPSIEERFASPARQNVPIIDEADSASFNVQSRNIPFACIRRKREREILVGRFVRCKSSAINCFSKREAASSLDRRMHRAAPAEYFNPRRRQK